MRRFLITPSAGMAVCIGGMALASFHDHGETVKVLSSREIQEKLDGQEAGVTAVEVTIEPGQSGASHRHPGPGFVYVLEGEYELGIDDQPIRRFQAGQTFYEPTGCLHRVSRNPTNDRRTRLIAFIVHPRTAQDIAIPEHGR